MNRDATKFSAEEALSPSIGRKYNAKLDRDRYLQKDHNYKSLLRKPHKEEADRKESAK